MKDIETDTHIIHSKTNEAREKDIAGEKYIWDDNSVLAFNEEDNKKAWKQHYERLLYVVFP